MLLCWYQNTTVDACNGPRSSEYLDCSQQWTGYVREMDGSKNQSENAECKTHPPYSSVQEQGSAQVLITVLVSDQSLVFDGKLTLPTICLY